MGKIIQMERKENIPKVQHDLGKETAFLADCYRDGWAPMFCPSCGAMLGGMIPMTTDSFECGVCNARWVCDNFEELFDIAYPRAGEK